MFHKYSASHRSTPTTTRIARLRSQLRKFALSSGIAVAGTGLVVASGMVAQDSPDETTATAFTGVSPTTPPPSSPDREERVSRSAGDRQPLVERAKAAGAKAAQAKATKARAKRAERRAAASRSLERARSNPQQLARTLMPEFGMPASQFNCLDNLWSSESGWKVNADNPTSSAYGIPQALPGSKMSSAGPDWENNPETQIRWGLGYINDRYGTACDAWSFKQGAGWY